MRRKILLLFVTVLLLLNCSLNVTAEDFDPQKTGSICITLTEQDTTMPPISANCPNCKKETW